MGHDQTRRGLPAGGPTLRTAAQLVAAGLAPAESQAALDLVADRYAVAIPPALAALIGHADDPIGRQFVPHPDELVVAPHEAEDPIGDDALAPVAGIVHRYPDRVLLKPLLICPTYCRFCFRREHVGPDGGLLGPAELDAAIAYIADRPQLREVILTGGDPLMLSARRLGDIVRRLAAIGHVEIVRVHTRVPMAAPELVTDALADALDSAAAVFVVVHANHADELTEGATTALRRIQARGVPVLGQSVLLRGVNDSVAALEALLRRMLRLRIKPYYLHQLDAAPGTARFHVPVAEGRAILQALRGRISGLAWPTYVVDVPGGRGKVPVGPDWFVPQAPGGPAGDAVRDLAGRLVALDDR